MLPVKVGDGDDYNLRCNVGAAGTGLHVPKLADEGVVVTPSAIKVHEENRESLGVLHALLEGPQSLTGAADAGDFEAAPLQHEVEGLAALGVRVHHHGSGLGQAAAFQAQIALGGALRALLTLAPILGADGGAFGLIEGVRGVAPVHVYGVGTIEVGRRGLLQRRQEQVFASGRGVVSVHGCFLFQV